MTTNIDENVLKRIKKALNTAAPDSGATEAEAETAMMLAQRMMVKHGLTMADVQDVNTEKVNKEVIHGYGSKRERRVWWKGSLANVIGENFKCFTYYTRYRDGKSCVRFLGLKEDVEIAVEVFQYACEIIEYHSKRYVNRRKKEAEKSAGVDFKALELEELEDMARFEGVNVHSVHSRYSHDTAIYKMRLIMAIKDAMGITIKSSAIKNDYISGFIKGLEDKFQEQVNKEGWGLVLVKDALVTQELDNMNFKSAAPTSAQGSGDRDAKAAGYTQGKKFNGAPKGNLNSGQSQLN